MRFDNNNSAHTSAEQTGLSSQHAARKQLLLWAGSDDRKQKLIDAVNSLLIKADVCWTVGYGMSMPKYNCVMTIVQ